jgi:hypothetical protein
MKGLVGTWRPVDQPASPLLIRFSLTAGGTVLVEEWRRSDRAHSLTVYHRDGAQLVATHYCPQGNQPRLSATPQTGTTIGFVLRDATDLDAAKEAYLIALAFNLSSKETLVRRETYRHGTKDDTSELKLARD